MKLVLKDNIIIATHDDDQDITVSSHYPTATDIVTVASDVNILDEYGEYKNYSELSISEDQGWAAVRVDRDALLLESDIYALVDRYDDLSSEQKIELIDYRQDLRDIPQDFPTVSSVEWPTKPNFIV